MNYYESIQTAIDHMEEHLLDEVKPEQAALVAYMSMSNFYRLFFALTGCGVMEYIRLRRLHYAAAELKAGKVSVLETAVKYGFSSADAFARAFKVHTGLAPSAYARADKTFVYERVNIMEKYFPEQDAELQEKYPDIKLIKDVPGFYAAACQAVSLSPELDAFVGLKAWFDEQQIAEITPGYRVYGYDVPNTRKTDGSYGYEVVVSVPEDFPVKGEGIIRKYFAGGLYAIMETTVGEIVGAWQRFGKWLELSRYEMGRHPCLEEHDVESGFLHRNNVNPENIKISLYMPLVLKNRDLYLTLELPQSRVAYYRAYGQDMQDLPMRVWDVMLSWAKAQHLDSSECRIYLYNHGFTKVKEYWFEIMITLPDGFVFTDDKVAEKTFAGGRYLAYQTNFPNLTSGWQKLLQHAQAEGIRGGRHQWVEFWELPDWSFPPEAVTLCFPSA